MRTVLRICSIAKSSSLAGAGPGMDLRSRLIAALPPKSDTPVVVFLDLDGVEIVSASFLREAFFELRNWVRRERPDVYPVIANATLAMLEDLEIIAEKRGPMIACDLTDKGHVTALRIVGQLDPKARLAFDRVHELRETTIRDLIDRQTAADAARPTAWNNRLATLVELGLVTETTAGRAKVYRPVLVEE